MLSEARLVDDDTASLISSDVTYYALLIPCLIPVLITFHFLIWLGHEFFVNN